MITSRLSHSPPTLNLSEVSVYYGQKMAISQVSLTIPSGKISVLVGPSGCGKSSLLASINRMTDLTPNCRVSGKIHIDQQNILHPSTSLMHLRRQVGMVFQQPNPFPLSIEDNIRFPLKEHGQKDPKQVQKITQKVLEDVGLWKEVSQRLKTPALQLSGGQQQRLCIARCLALSPDVLLFDEPCSALDPLATQKIETLIRQLRGRYTILMVTHNLSQARRLADYVAVCWTEESGAGCVVESGDNQRIFEHSVHPITRSFCQGVDGATKDSPI
jgi:phosphate transport system ATP-binding protein